MQDRPVNSQPPADLPQGRAETSVPRHSVGFAERHSQQAFVQGLDGAGMAFALRALEESDAKSTANKSSGFAQRELMRRRANAERQQQGGVER